MHIIQKLKSQPTCMVNINALSNNAWLLHESSVGLASTTNPRPRGNPPIACSGKPMSIQQ